MQVLAIRLLKNDIVHETFFWRGSQSHTEVIKKFKRASNAVFAITNYATVEDYLKEGFKIQFGHVDTDSPYMSEIERSFTPGQMIK